MNRTFRLQQTAGSISGMNPADSPAKSTIALPPEILEKPMIEGSDALARFRAAMAAVISAPKPKVIAEVNVRREAVSANPNRRGPKKKAI